MHVKNVASGKTLHRADATSFSGCTVGVSSDPVSSVRVQAGAGIILSVRSDPVVLDWIPDNGRSCVVRLDAFVSPHSSPHLFVVRSDDRISPGARVIQEINPIVPNSAFNGCC